MEYKRGKENKVADALSKKEESSTSLSTTSVPTAQWLDELKESYLEDSTKELLAKWEQNELNLVLYNFRNGILSYKGRLFVGSNTNLREALMQQAHASPVGGHLGYDKSLHRLRCDFYWPGLKQHLRQFIWECTICQQNKHENVAPRGLLQPLLVPDRVWSHITMDFIEGLPLFEGYSVIYMVVDRLSKYSHFIPLTHPYSASKVVQVFMTQVFKLHGLLESIISDRDTTFTSTFWMEIFKLQGTKLSYSTAYHPQTDGQSKIVNKYLENYLRCFMGDRPKDWSQWVPLAEWWYSTNFHASSKLIPYEIVYGQLPPKLLPYEVGTTQVVAVDMVLCTREQTLQLLKENLLNAQHRMKHYSGLKRSERAFKVGDWVYLRL